MQAEDRHLLIDFLLQQPLVIKHKEALLVHAGIPPSWGENTVFKQSSIVEQYLQSNDVGAFINNMYDNRPYTWSNDLNEMDACRYTINACMRMRFCKADDTLEFDHKMNHDTAPEGFKAWFLHDNRVLKETDIFFGHWSTLSKVGQAHVYPMDQGCAWGGRLSVIRLEDRQIFSVNC
jgi:bis(5'-nucleosyl)-tetraphosphatase (symmetrical)